VLRQSDYDCDNKPHYAGNCPNYYGESRAPPRALCLQRCWLEHQARATPPLRRLSRDQQGLQLPAVLQS